jgi:hypothetical protein
MIKKPAVLCGLSFEYFIKGYNRLSGINYIVEEQLITSLLLLTT